MNAPISCLIVDDEPLARNLLAQYVSKVPYLQLIKSCAGPMEALDLLRRQPADLLFLDIQMPEITGLHLLKVLPRRPLVILTTAYSEYALEGYELDVADYLLKPITFDRFLRATEKAAERLRPLPAAAPPAAAAAAPAAEPAYLFVKDGQRLVKVMLRDLRYIEGLRDYVILHVGDKRVVTLQRLKSLEEELPQDRFVRIHNSYIVSFDAIEAIEKDKVWIGKTELPVSDTYRQRFRAFLEKRQGL
jgi:DNA-binding LytR/AlgR family response regulator